MMPRGDEVRGREAIHEDFKAQLSWCTGCAFEIIALAVSGNTVFTERIDRMKITGAPVEVRVAGVFGVDDAGNEERVVIWIERKEGGIWAVGRAVNPDWRTSREPRPEDYVFEGYELGDALQAANETLEDDFTVSEGDGHGELVKPFTRDELLKPLEKWFFGRS